MAIPFQTVLKINGLFAATMLVGPSTAFADLYTLSTISFPGSSHTFVSGINNAGQMVGYHDTNLGFLRNPDGTFVDINYPGQSASIASGLNDIGQVVGYYLQGSGVSGFVLNPDGSVVDMVYPGAEETVPYGINNIGQVVGSINVGGGQCHGFVYGSIGFTAFDKPGAVCTGASGIADNGDIVGGTSDPWGGGYLRRSDGLFSPIIVPGISSYLNALDINNRGQVVGTYLDGAIYRGFLYEGGVFTNITYPGAWLTEVTGINDRGEIVGIYHDGTEFHGLYGITPATSVPEPRSYLLLGTVIVSIWIGKRSKERGL